MSQRICKGREVGFLEIEKSDRREEIRCPKWKEHTWVCIGSGCARKKYRFLSRGIRTNLASASTPQGVINFSCFLILPQDISVFTGAAGPFRAVLLIAVIRVTGCRRSYFFIKTKLKKKKKLQASLEDSRPPSSARFA